MYGVRSFLVLQAEGCRPDSVTYSALISAYEKGGQWRKALEVPMPVPLPARVRAPLTPALPPLSFSEDARSSL